MARLKLYNDNYIDSTVVSNCFIDEYMKDANDAQLKIYLYLLRMISANREASVSDIADKFNHTEKDINRALKYWEKRGVLSLVYDSERNLCGIRLCDLSAPGVAASENRATQLQMLTTDVVPAPIPMPVATHISMPVETISPVVEEEAPRFVKPSYSADQLKAFKQEESTSQLLFIAETYIGKTLTPSEMRSILFFKDVLGFSDDLVDYLLQYCVDRDKKDFRYIEKVAINWAESGITTPKQAQKFSSKFDKNVYAIMNQLGKNGSPTNKELEFITRWTRDYGFSTDIIFEACERTVLATDKHRFEYAEGILANWRRENVHHKSDIKKLDDAYSKKRTVAAANPTAKATSNSFNNYTQNGYDYAALEQAIMSN